MNSLFSELLPSNRVKSLLAALAACALLGCGGGEVETAPEVVVEASSDEPPPPPETEAIEGRLTLEESARLMAPKTNHLIAAPSVGMADIGDGLSFVEALRAKAEAGDIGSAYLLGFQLIKGDGVEQDLNEGAKWVKLAADRNNPKAQALLGRLYEDGKGVSQNIPLAYAWHLIAARKDDPDAIERIGILNERLSEQDLEEAERLAAGFVPK